MKKAISLILAVLFTLTVVPADIFAANDDIKVLYNGTEIEFEIKPEKKGEEIMCEMGPLFDAIGIIYKYNAVKGELEAVFDEQHILNVTLGEKKLVMDEVPVELEQPFYKVRNTVMVPLEKLCYVYNIDIDKSNPEEVKLFWEKSVKEVYDHAARLTEIMIPYEDRKTTIMDGGLEFFETAKRSREDCWEEKVVDIEGQSFDKAFNWKVTDIPQVHYDAQINKEFTTPLYEGDVVMLQFWARSISARNDSGLAQTQIVCEEIGSWTKNHIDKYNLTGDWKYYNIIFSPVMYMTYWQLCFRIHLYYEEVQFADVKLSVYRDLPDGFVLPDPPVEYPGMEEDALWRKEALKRIEQHRKNNMIINVVDEDGNPVENAEVKADMTRHEFKWGVCFYYMPFAQGSVSNKTGYAGEVYLNKIKEYQFNYVVEGYSNKMEGYDPKSLAPMFNWLKKNDIEYRAHSPYWEGKSVYTPWVLAELNDQNWNPDTVSHDELRKRIEYSLNKLWSFGLYSQPTQVDVVNELVTRYASLTEKLGFDEVVRYFDIARQLYPDAKLYMTETSIGNTPIEENASIPFAAYVKYLVELGADIDGVGIQGHVGTALYPQNWITTIDYTSKYVDEAAITEFDMTTRNNSERAPYLRDSLIAAFSHPKITSFICWTPYSTNDQSLVMLWDIEGNDLPAGEVWKDMINNQWMTHETLNTDENGSTLFRGFRGRYDINVTVGGKTGKITVNLAKDEDKNVVTAIVGKDGITLKCDNEYKPDPDKVPFVDWRKGNELSDLEMPQIKYEIQRTDIISAVDSHGTETSEVFDETDKTFWSQRDKNDMLTISLESVAPLKKICIDWHPGTIMRYNRRIEISNDMENWTEVANGRNSIIKEEVDLSSYEGKYIRISGGDGKLAIDEIRIFEREMEKVKAK